VPGAVLEAYADPFQLRFVPADDPAVPDQAALLFRSAAFRVSDRSNRTGYRLSGPRLAVASAGDRLSEPLAPGAIQLPPDGQPILLMADRQTIGGYPLLGHLVSADRPRAAQLWPGDEVHFRAVDLDQARRAARALAAP
jgi:antagonist of KipI